MPTPKRTFTIITNDGKEHQVSEDNINKYGMDAYAEGYEGATVRMRDNDKEDYDIPLANYDDAVAAGLHPFRIEHPEKKEPAQAPAVSEQPEMKAEQPAQQPAAPIQEVQAVQPQTPVQPDTASVTPGIQDIQPEQPAQVQQPVEGGIKFTPQEVMALDSQMAAMKGQINASNEGFNERMKNLTSVNPLTLQSKPRVKFNEKTGRFENVYGTSTGESTTSESLAGQVNRAVQDQHVREWEATTEEGQQHAKQRMKDREDEYVRAMQNFGSFWAANDPDNAAEKAWADAEAQTAKDNETAAKSIYGGSAWLNGGREMHRVNAGSFQGKKRVNHMKNHDLDKLFDDAWTNLGKEGQEKAVDYCYRHLARLYPGADGNELRKIAEENARQQSDQRMYNLAVEKNLPKDNLEYLMRKIAKGNSILQLSEGLARSTAGTTGDMAAAEQADQLYEQGGLGRKATGIGGMVLGFAADPLTVLTGAAGKATATGAAWVGGKVLAGKGASSLAVEAATRQFTSTTAGRIITGMSAGAGNFGAYEFGKEGLNQWQWGGHINPSNGKNEGYSFGKMVEAGEHGTMMGAATGWIAPAAGQLSDRLARATTSTAGKIGVRTGQFAGTVLTEGTIFSIPEWIEGSRDAFDVWTDNQAMMLGFKGHHALKTGVSVIGDMFARGGRVGFETRLRSRLDGHPDLGLTKDEQRELDENGYGDLKDLVTDKEIVDEMNAKRGTSTSTDLATKGEVKSDEEYVSHLQSMMEDSSISEAARAKMYYLATGRMLPMSTVMSCSMEKVSDGFIVNSYGANGVITSRRHSTKKGAEAEMQRINRQMELNYVAVGERYTDGMSTEKSAEAALDDVFALHPEYADKSELYRRYKIYRDLNPEERTEQEQRLVDEMEAAMKDHEGDSSSKILREGINETYGVDIDKALAKEPNRRSKEEQQALEEYTRALFPEGSFEEVKPEGGDVPGGGAPEGPRTPLLEQQFDESYRAGYEAEDKDKNAISSRYQAAKDAVCDMFDQDKDMDDDALLDYLMDYPGQTPAQLITDSYETLDTEGERLYTAEHLNILAEFFNAKAAYDGMLQGVRDGIDAKVEAQLKVIDENTHADGMIHKGTDLDGNEIHIVSGTVATFEDGTIDAGSSSDMIVIRDANGELKPVSADKIGSLDPQLYDPVQLKEETEAKIRDGESRGQANIIDGLSFEPDTEVVILDADNSEKRGLIQRRVREENGQYVTDPNGSIVEYYVEGDTAMRYSPADELGKMIVSFTMPQQEQPVVSEGEVQPEPEVEGQKQLPYESAGETPALPYSPAPTPVNDGAAAAEPEAAQEPGNTVIPVGTSGLADTRERDADGNLVYEKLSPEETLEDLRHDFNNEEVDAFIDAKQKEAEAEYAAAKDKTPTANIANKVQYVAERDAIAAEQQAALDKIEYWGNVRAVIDAEKDAQDNAAAPAEDKQEPETDDSNLPSHINKDGYISDTHGEPIVLYHGTENGDITAATQLEPGHRRVDGEKAIFNGNGISFTPDRGAAADYAGKDGKVLEAKIKLTKPYVTYGNSNMTEEEAVAFSDKLKEQGYGGIVVYPSVDMRKVGAMPMEVIAFDRSSIEDVEQDKPQEQESEDAVVLEKPETWVGKTFFTNGMHLKCTSTDNGYATFDNLDTYMGMGFEVQKVQEYLRNGEWAVLSDEKENAGRTSTSGNTDEQKEIGAGKASSEQQGSLPMLKVGDGRKFDLYRYANETHPLFSGVHYRQGVAEVTDGTLLLAMPCNYDESLEGKVIDKKGNEIDRKYVNVDLMLQGLTVNDRESFDLDAFEKRFEEVVSMYAQMKGKKAWQIKKDATDYIAIQTGGMLHTVKLNRLANFLKALRFIGATHIGTAVGKNTGNGTYNLVAKTKGGALVILATTPVMVSNNSGFPVSERIDTNSMRLDPKQVAHITLDIQKSDTNKNVSMDTLQEHVKDAAEPEAIETDTPAADTGYTIEPRKDTRDNSDIYAVKFSERVSKDEFKGQRAIAKQFGGYWSNFGKKGFLFKTQDAAKDFAEAIMGRSPKEVADERPLSVNDIKDLADKAAEPKEEPRQEKPNEEPGKQQNEEPKEEPKADKAAEDDPYHTAEERAHYEELKKRMRAKLNQLNAGMDPELLAIGVEMAMYHFKGGLRRFAEFCKVMISDCGDKIRPHLKMIYQGSRETNEFIEKGWDKEMDAYEDVHNFDVLNFDKKKDADVFKKAEHIDAEIKSERKGKELQNEAKEKRNQAGKDDAPRRLSDFKTASKFMPDDQKKVVRKSMDEHAPVMERIEKEFAEIPGYRENEDHKVYAHYFSPISNTDVFVLEYDPKYDEFYAYTILNGDTQMSEFGNIGREELTKTPGMELDFYWDKEPLGDTLRRIDPDMFGDFDKKEETVEDVIARRLGVDYVNDNRKHFKSNTKKAVDGLSLNEIIEKRNAAIAEVEKTKSKLNNADSNPNFDEGKFNVLAGYYLLNDEMIKACTEALQNMDPDNNPPTGGGGGNKSVSSAESKITDLHKNSSNQLKEENNDRENVQGLAERTSGAGKEGLSPDKNGTLGEGEQHEPERTERQRVDKSGSTDVLHDGLRSGRVAGEHESGKELVRNSRNFRSEPGTNIVPKSPKARYNANVKAIKLLKKIQEEGREATDAEKKVLATFSGWGALNPQLSDPDLAHELKELIGEEAFNEAALASKSAYYTPSYIIDELWNIAKNLGFKGGNILEGSAGIGNILSLMPADISANSSVEAVEKDTMTGGILKLLYPDAKVTVDGFQATRIPNGSVDLAITNVPFVTDLRVKDTTGDKDLGDMFHNLHDFCIAKNVRKLKPGGIGIFITSSGTLDRSQKLRNWLTTQGDCDAVGAFRMNQKTFVGAPVTTDIIILRRRVNGIPLKSHAINITNTTMARNTKLDTGKTRTDKKTGEVVSVYENVPLIYNEYFVNHPENMGGEMGFGFEHGDTFRPRGTALYPVSSIKQEQRLKQWAESFKSMLEDFAHDTELTEDEPKETVVTEVAGSDMKEGQLTINKAGEICTVEFGRVVPAGVNSNKVRDHSKKECFESYSAIKKALDDVLKYESGNSDDDGLQPLLDELNRAYDDFVKTYGYLNKNSAIAFLRRDVDFAALAAVEKYEEVPTQEGKPQVVVSKTDVFKSRVVDQTKAPHFDNIKDGVIVSLSHKGRIDPRYISFKLHKAKEEVVDEILKGGLGYINPVNGSIEASYEYLSGNIREKLRQAEVNNQDGRFDENIKALKGVMPMQVPAHLIEFTLGTGWIDHKIFEEFITEKTGVEKELTEAGGSWHTSEDNWGDKRRESNRLYGVFSKLKQEYITGTTLILAAMNNKSISVSVKRSDGTYEYDKEASRACNAKMDDIRGDFREWLRDKMTKDGNLAKEIEDTYNEKFNNFVPKKVPVELAPKHFEGASNHINLYDHQRTAVMRALTEPLLLAHEVGSGKTFTLITTAMEMRRLGLAKKPMIVVQNATIGQFIASAKELYPTAKILTMEDRDHNAEGRKRFYAKIKYNDVDMIIIPQSVFEKIPDSIERRAAFINEKIEEKLQVLDEIKKSKDDSRSASTIKNEIKKLKGDLSDLDNAREITPAPKKGRKNDAAKEAERREKAKTAAEEQLDRRVDEVESFDDMGIDALLVDEAHEYKHLGFATAMQRGVKGVDGSYSKKSAGVYLKVQAVKDRNGGKNIVFATGTPISNTAAEVWTFMRYLMPKEQMKAYNIYYFDDFVRNFGNIAQVLEFSTTGQFKENNRFSGYNNLPELIRIWAGVSDTVLSKDTEVSKKIPPIAGGKAEDIFIPQSQTLRKVMKSVRKELEAFDNMSGTEKKENTHIPIVMYGVAKAAAIDPRLVMSTAPDEDNSKTNVAAKVALDMLAKCEKYNGTVAIFCDTYQNKRTGFNVYYEVKKKMVESGFPADQIEIIESKMTSHKKETIFDAVNKGKVRVIMGSTFTLGTGVNIQERLFAIIHLDVPKRHMDYTQRNGRELRQGNMHKVWNIPVHIIRLGVEDSMDVTAYQMLKTKAAIADSIMNGEQLLLNNQENRSIEEEEEAFGDTVAKLSGSQYAMLKNQAERELKKYQNRKKQHETDQAYIFNRIPQIESLIELMGKKLKEQESIAQKIKSDYPAGNIEVVRMDGKNFTDLKELEKYVTKDPTRRITSAEKALREENSWASRTDVSFNIEVGPNRFRVKVELVRERNYNGDYVVHRNLTYSCPELGIEKMEVDGKGTLMNFFGSIGKIVNGSLQKNLIDTYKQNIENYKGELKVLEGRKGIPFKFDKELSEAATRADEYAQLMKAEIAEKEAKYKELDENIEEAPIDVSTTEDLENTDEEDSDNDENSYREVSEGELLHQLREASESGRTIKVYRTMQVIDGELYSPMAKKVAGKETSPIKFRWEAAEEHPELARQGDGSKSMPNEDSFYIVIDKGQGKGSLTVAYNPYTHTSRTVLNDQFSSAFIRPNLVVVEVEVPKSELEHIYKAEKAKDPVGEMNWHSGAVSGKLAELGNPRKVILTRYDKPVRILTKKEEAQMIAKALEGTGIAMPYNLVTPQVRAELERLGVEIDENPSGRIGENKDFGKAEYVTDEQIEAMNNKLQSNAVTAPESIRRTAVTLAEKMHTQLTVINDVNEITSPDAEQQQRMRNSKGWYNTRTGEVVVVVPNNLDAEDAASTVFHEVVGHKGLRELVGEKNYRRFLEQVYLHCKESVRKKITEKAAKHAWDFAKATDEYLSELAEKNPEELTSEEHGVWKKIKALVMKAIDKFLETLHLPKSIKLGDNELRYMLWRSYQKLVHGKEDVFQRAADVVKRQEQKVGHDEVVFREEEKKPAAKKPSGETDDIWKDKSLGIQERISAAAARLSSNHAEDKTLRNEAVKAIGRNLTELRKAMSQQRKFDQDTVKRVADLAKVLMQYGFLNNLSQYEVKRLLAAVKNSVGHDDIDASIDKVMDIMVSNQLKNAENTLHHLMTIKATKVDAKGVQVQGKLDVKGQTLMQVMKKARGMQEDEIIEAISAAADRMSSEDHSVAEEAAVEYEGLNLALEYAQNITGSKVEERNLHDELKKAHEDASAEERATESYKQYVEATRQAIRQNLIDRAAAYYELVGKMAGTLRESMENAENFKEAEKLRIQAIHHNANSDMFGRKPDEHRTDDWKDRFMNNSFVSFMFAPLASFDQMMRMFGSHSVNGEGYLWNRYMRGWVDAREKEITGVRQKYAQLDDKVHEIFGSSAKSMADAIRLEGRLPKVPVRFYNGGEMKETELNQGNIMYIYMVNKMLDGRMKLRKMGISEKDVAELEEQLDPRYKELADWMQDEFLVDTRNEYNETHKRMFGASMAAVENYFPLKINKRDLVEKVDDLDNIPNPEGVITSKTGSIIKRTRNNKSLDITNADALNVLLQHVAEMEHWNAYAEWNRDLNTLRTYKRFRNQVMNMTSIYGGGEKLWKRFNDLCRLAAGSYRPQRARLDEATVNFAKGVTAAKVSLRLFTALKQFLSMPAYIPEARADYWAKDIINPYSAWHWCYNNLPIFRERWESRTSGDPRLMKSDMDWGMWRNRIMQMASRIGMSPNAFVDALTVSIGTHAMYKTRLARYKKDGYSDAVADRRAKQDATILFNQTQQSSEAPFLSPMQVDRSWLSVLFSVFRNSSMSYTRQLYDALRNLKRAYTPGYKAKSLEFMEKQFVRDGLDEKHAKRAAERKFRKQIIKDKERVAVFGYILQFAWNLGAYLPYLIFGNDDDEKQKMMDDVWAHTAFGSIEGLTGGDVMSLAGSMLVSGEGNPAYLNKDMPLTSDLFLVMKKLGSDKQVEAVNDIVNLVVQSGIGLNPQSITDSVLAIMDACGDDPELAHEASIFVMRLLQVPQSQIEKMYFDEIGLDGEEISKYTPAQLCGRYAQYKVKRGRFNAPWTWDDADTKNWEKIARTNIKERLSSLGDKNVNDGYNEIAEKFEPMAELDKAMSRAKDSRNVGETGRVAAMIQAEGENYIEYKRFKSLDANLNRMVKLYMNASTPQEAAFWMNAVITYKKNMVDVMEADNEEEMKRRMRILSDNIRRFGEEYSKLHD